MEQPLAQLKAAVAASQLDAGEKALSALKVRREV